MNRESLTRQWASVESKSAAKRCCSPIHRCQCQFEQPGSNKLARARQQPQFKATALATPRDAGILEEECLSCGWELREATADELWQVSELHCRSFHPDSRWLTAVLQRFDRLSSFKAVESQVKAGWGHFACVVAIDKSLQPNPRLLSSGAVNVPPLLKGFVPLPYRGGFERSLEDSGIVGTVCVDSTGQFVPMKKINGQLYKRDGVAYLSNLAVDHNFRRKGIGRRLLDQAAEIAKGWGCRSITLQCDPRNRGARQMYARGGYRHVAYESPILQYWEGRMGVRLELMCKWLHK